MQKNGGEKLTKPSIAQGSQGPIRQPPSPNLDPTRSSFALRRSFSKDDSGKSFFFEQVGDLKISKREIYMELVESKFPESYEFFFKDDNKQKFGDYLSQCRDIASQSGMATVDVLLLSFFSRENNLAILFRPVNLKTRDQMKVQDSIGKDSSISLKSSNFGPIEGCIPRYAGLSKLSENFVQNQAIIAKNNVTIEGKLNENLDAIESIRAKTPAPSEDEIINQKFLVSTPKTIEYENAEYPLYFFPDIENTEKVQCDKQSRPYFAIVKEGRVLFYNYDNSKYEEVAGDNDLSLSDAQVVEVLAYKSYKPLKDDKFETETGNLSRYEVEEKTIIPDYDIYTLGKKRIFDKEAILEESQKQSEPESESRILANIEFKKLLESLRFDKIDKMSTVSYGNVEIINRLSELTGDQVNHGAETTNSNTQDLSNQNALIFSWEGLRKDDSKTPVESMKSAVRIFKENEREIVEILNELRSSGCDIEIGSRWGFEVDRESGEVSSFDRDSKIKHWSEKAIEEKKLIEALKDCCKTLYSQGGEGDFKEFLEVLSKKFENEKIRRFIKSEYFSEEEIANQVAQSIGSVELTSRAEDKLKILLDRLDIIAQEEKIKQLELVSPLIFNNYKELSEADKKIADSAKVEYEEIIKTEISSRKESLEKKVLFFLSESQRFAGDKAFCDIIALSAPIKMESSDIARDILGERGERRDGGEEEKFGYPPKSGSNNFLLACFSALSSCLSYCAKGFGLKGDELTKPAARQLSVPKELKQL